MPVLAERRFSEFPVGIEDDREYIVSLKVAIKQDIIIDLGLSEIAESEVTSFCCLCRVSR